MNEWVGRMVAFVIIPLMLITIYEVIMRKLFNSPTTWVFETSNQLYALLIMLGLGFAMLHASHASIDTLVQFLSPRVRAIIDTFCFIIFFFPFCIILFVHGFLFAAQSWAMLEVSQSVLRIPLYPIKTTIPIMALTLLLQGSVVLIHRLHVIFKGRELQV